MHLFDLTDKMIKDHPVMNPPQKPQYETQSSIVSSEYNYKIKHGKINFYFLHTKTVPLSWIKKKFYIWFILFDLAVKICK